MLYLFIRKIELPHLPPNALRRDCNGKCIELIEGHALEVVVEVYASLKQQIPSQLGIFIFTFTVKRFHIYGALLHSALKVFTFTRPYYIFTFRGATVVL